jgi:hypothetical protein
MIRAGQVALKAEKRNTYRLMVGKPEVKRPLGRWNFEKDYEVVWT